MDLYTGRPFFEATSTPPVALHEFLSQKVHPFYSTYGCTYEVSSSSMDEEGGGVRSVSCETSGETQPASGTKQDTGSSHPDPIAPRPGTPRSEDSLPHTTSENGGNQPPETSELPNWQNIRRQLLPKNRGDHRIAEWIRGWSMGVTEYGEETYCGCGDAPAASGITVLPLSVEVKERSHTAGPSGIYKGRRKDKEPGDSQGQQQQSSEQVTASTTPPPATRTFCPNCDRPLASLIPPEDREWNAWHMSRLTNRLKNSLRRFLGHDQRLHMPRRNGHISSRLACKSVQPEHKNATGSAKETNKDANQPNIQTGASRHQQSREPDSNGDDDEVDPNRLSIATTEEGRPLVDVEERQARLRRAQKLLAKSNAKKSDGDGDG